MSPSTFPRTCCQILREDRQACAMSPFYLQDDRTKDTACEALVQKILALNKNFAKHPSAPCACGAMRVRAAVWSVRHSWRQIPGFQESPTVTVSLSDRYKSTIRGITRVNLPPPSLACPWMWMRPTCRGWSGKERGGSGRTNRCCIWKSGRFREAKLRRGAAGVLPSSRRTSGTSELRHTVIFGHTRTDTGFYWYFSNWEKPLTSERYRPHRWSAINVLIISRSQQSFFFFNSDF